MDENTVNEITIVANAIDANEDGKVDMISFLNEKGSVGLAIDTDGSGTVDKIYVFQDVTGDGKLDTDDEKRIEEIANGIIRDHKTVPEEPLLIPVAVD